MTTPEWADDKLSADLPVLRARGEGQELEYMELFPNKALDLAKEIAAFATSNQGTILIGVSDDGDLIGLPEATTPEGRDSLSCRIGGICDGTVRPSITPAARFAIEGDQIVLVLVVPKGSQPVYYSRNIPYLRHMTESRSAEPHEVVELVQAWLPMADLGGNQADPYTELLSRLAPLLIDVIIYAEQAEERSINPWLDMWRAQYGQVAVELRSLAAEDVAVSKQLTSDLSDLANALDRVANFRLYLGGGSELSGLVNQALQMARQLKEQRIDTLPVSDTSLASARDILISSLRRLDDLVQRMDGMVNQGKVEDVQAEASQIGETVLRIGHYGVDALSQGLGERLRAVGRDLHLIETMRLYMDGGRSLQAVTDAVQRGAQRLTDVTETLRQRDG